jgi:hypothetical protein
MNAAAEEAVLAREFRLFAAHLVGCAATPYQISKYVDFHVRRDMGPRGDFDRFLVAVARSNSVGLALADGYSGLLARRSLLRKKMMAALAILECSAPSFGVLDAPESGGLLVYVRMGLRVALAGLVALIGIIVLGPARLWFMLAKPS